MRTRALVGIVFVALAIAGCEGQLNPQFCARHLDDEDCRNAGLVSVDAPKPECVESADCAGNPNGQVCDTARNMCVECVRGVEDAVCTTQMMVCGADQTCHGCIVDSDCQSTSMVCLPSQSCAMEASVLYAAPTAAGSACSKASPCPLEIAVQQLSPERHIIKMTTTFSGVDYLGPPIVIDKPYGVQIIGTGTTFRTTAPGDALTAAGQNLEVLAMAIINAQGNGVTCTSGTLTLRRTIVSNSARYGLESTACNVTAERSRFANSPVGGILVTSGVAELRNNIIDRNGGPNTENGAVHIVNGSGRLVFNTIAINNSRSGGGARTGGVKCSADKAGFAVKRNIIADNGAANATSQMGNCDSVGNYETRNANDVKFLNTTDFRLTANSPPGAVLNDADATDDCKLNGEFIDDYHGALRPFDGFCDVGSDELSP